MEIHKLGALWVAWAVFGGRPVYSIADTFTKAIDGVNREKMGLCCE